MTTSLIVLVSIHVFAILIAAMAFYALWLLLLAKRGATKKALLWRASIGFITACIAWGLDLFFLADYYLGKESPVTTTDVTTLIPTFVFFRAILLPLVVATAAVILVVLWRKGNSITSASPTPPSPDMALPRQSRLLSRCIITLTGLATISSAVLAFLGVMVP